MELKNLGAKMRKVRQEKSLTLKEVENLLSIRAGYLGAIEEGTIHDYLSGVYATGFLKQYALFLGLDIPTLIHEYPKAFNRAQEEHDFTFGIGTLEMRKSLNGGVNWLPSVLWAVGIGACVITVYYLVKVLGLV